ncbi:MULTISPECIES: hypothetical protein [unclassified Mesorhizobium]|uniref:hypothetical protein n=1 Tax=unclassified Mesorhizobium TaxID=325217 RepID=UPI001FE16F9C|nr:MULTISPECIES: hypothetical protein [unclassified Mesorhizobium]
MHCHRSSQFSDGSVSVGAGLAATRYGVMMLREAVVDPAAFKAARRPTGQSGPLGAFR